MSLEPISRSRLAGVHPDLVRVIERAAQTAPPFRITCGLRTAAEQKVLVATGKSRTMKSRHLTGHAVDYVALPSPGKVSWEPDAMRPIAEAFKRAAGELSVAIEWGGDWRSFVDMPHIQLAESAYPAGATAATILPEAPPITQPARPIAKSGTVWGTVVGAMTAIGAYVDSWLAGLLEWAAKLQEMAPVSSALASAGGNTKSILLGLGIGSAVYVISRRLKASDEGRPG